MKKLVALAVVLYAIVQSLSAMSVAASASESLNSRAAQIERAINN